MHNVHKCRLCSENAFLQFNIPKRRFFHFSAVFRDVSIVHGASCSHQYFVGQPSTSITAWHRRGMLSMSASSFSCGIFFHSTSRRACSFSSFDGLRSLVASSKISHRCLRNKVATCLEIRNYFLNVLKITGRVHKSIH